MRELLYKGKRKDNGEWIEGALFDGKNFTVIADKIFQSDQHSTIGNFRIFGKQIIRETVCENTGIPDKNKTIIFENDIISAHPDELFPDDEIRLIVVWHDYGWFGKDSKGGFISLESKWVNELFEVVGNKFDNPELLKGSAKNE